MSWARITAVGAALALAGGVTWAAAAEITLDRLPKAAKEALLELAGKNPITGVEIENERGVQVYEASWNAGGHEVEAEVTGDGALMGMEESVTAEEVPEAVRAAVERALPGAKNLRYEKLTIILYEAETIVNGAEKEIVVNPLGKSASHAEEADEGKEADDDKEDDDGEEKDEKDDK